jgi:hypothetical protein
MEVQGHYNYLYEFRVYSSWLPYLQIARHRLLSQHHRFHNIHRSLIILHPRLASLASQLHGIARSSVIILSWVRHGSSSQMS